MLATYPEVFAGGAIIAGLPYGCANNVQQALEAMFTEQAHTPQALGDRVRAASQYAMFGGPLGLFIKLKQRELSAECPPPRCARGQ
jgi:poly(3-hydroxybutyrate) depolymerase